MDDTTTIVTETTQDLPANTIVSSEDIKADSTAQEIVSEETANETALVPVTVVSDEDEMNQLHQDIEGVAGTFLSKGCDLGEKLTTKKAQLGHGKFTPWVKANLKFKLRTAQKYMSLHANRMLLIESASDAPLELNEAYDVIAKLSTKNKPKAVSDSKKLGASEKDNATETKNVLEENGESDVPQVTESIVADLTAEQSAQVLDFISGVGIDPALYDLLVAHGGIIRLNTAVQETPNSHLDSAVNAEPAMEAKNE